MKHPALVAASAIAMLMIPACQQPDNNAEGAAATATAAPAQPPVAQAPVPESPDPEAPDPEAVAGARIDLRPLTRADLAANPLDGELGCSFTATGGAGPLLVAMGVVQTGPTIFGLVKPGDAAERVGAAGNFGDLTRGLRLGGRGIDVTLTRGASRDSTGEETIHDATLRVDRADGSRRSYAGRWTCGP